jgi:putative tryptophan/tyrosine transport system substrate-binding protein
MRRREFIAGLGAAAWPVVARAQSPTKRLIGWLSTNPPEKLPPRYLAAFRKGLEETGYADGRNASIEYVAVDGRYDRLPAAAVELVRRGVEVIAAMGGSPAGLAAKAATSTIPIVFNVGVDPVQTGLVARLNRPGGNITGVTTLGAEAASKRLELIHELAPSVRRIGLLVNPTFATLADAVAAETRVAAKVLGVEITVLSASNEPELALAFAELARANVGALVIGTDSFFTGHSADLGRLTLQHSIPAIYEHFEYVANGGLMSYGANLPDQYRQSGVYVGRILNGEKPGDLPVQQATKVELIINMKTAKALGLTFPLTLLGRADEVVE